MRVAHSVYSWLPQTQTWIASQVRNLPEEIESTILCERIQNLDQFPAPQISALTSTRLGRASWLLPVALRRILRRRLALRIARRNGIQLFHSHFGDEGWLNLPVARRANLPHIVTFYGYDLSLLPRNDRRWRKRFDRLFREVDRVLCEGPFMAASAVTLGCPSEKVRVHHLGVELDRIPFRPRSWRPDETLRVLVAATFVEKKGIPYALESIARLRRATRVGVEVTIVGGSNGQPRSEAEKARIEETVRREDLASVVHFVGFQTHARLHEIARENHLFLAPSVTASDGDSEGGAPVVLLEMAASGMAIVSSLHCDIPQVVLDGTTGWLAPERDVETLAERLHRWADHPDAWPAMLAAGRRHVEAEYDAARLGEHLAAIYGNTMTVRRERTARSVAPTN